LPSPHGPQALDSHEVQDQTRTASMARQDLACSRSPLEMPGYLQLRDLHVRGVAHVRANDLANRGTGHSMTTSDNRARPACRSRRALTRADLSRHVEGDYGSQVQPDAPVHLVRLSVLILSGIAIRILSGIAIRFVLLRWRTTLPRSTPAESPKASRSAQLLEDLTYRVGLDAQVLHPAGLREDLTYRVGLDA